MKLDDETIEFIQNAIRTQMAEHDIRVKDIAETMGISHNYVSSFMNWKTYRQQQIRIFDAICKIVRKRKR